MFLPHIAARINEADAVSYSQPVPLAVPVSVVVSRCRDPRIDRGAALQVQHGQTWFDYSYHENAAAAVREFNRPKYGVVGPEFWRINCHELDLGALESVAVRQPEPVYT